MTTADYVQVGNELFRCDYPGHPEDCTVVVLRKPIEKGTWEVVFHVSMEERHPYDQGHYGTLHLGPIGGIRVEVHE